MAVARRAGARRSSGAMVDFRAALRPIVLAFFLATGAVVPAQDFLLRQSGWEAETGTPSRMTVYARIELLQVRRPPQEVLALLRDAERVPFTEDLEALAEPVLSYGPAFDAFDEAWSVASLTKLRERVESFGLTLDMIPLPLSSYEIGKSESPAILLGREPERERQLDGLCQMIRNASLAGMQGALWVLLSQMLFFDGRVNDGAYFAVEHHFPPGSWCNPEDPLVAYGTAWGFLIPSYTGLFRNMARAFYARGYREEVVCGYGFTGDASQGGGMLENGLYFPLAAFDLSSVGMGAMNSSATRDRHLTTWAAFISTDWAETSGHRDEATRAARSGVGRDMGASGTKGL